MAQKAREFKNATPAELEEDAQTLLDTFEEVAKTVEARLDRVPDHVLAFMQGKSAQKIHDVAFDSLQAQMLKAISAKWEEPLRS